MILNNYTNMLKRLQESNQTASASIKNISGANTYVQANYAKLATYGDIRVGTGTTKPTASDNALGNDVTSSLSAGNIARTFSTDSNNVDMITIVRVYTNETANPIVISEYGICNTKTNYDTAVVLLTKEVLDNPITVGAGESITITAVLK